MNASSGRSQWPGRAGLPLMIRQWGPVIALAAAVAGGASFAVSAVLPREYKATAQLYVAPAANPTAALQDVLLGQNLAKTYVQLATADVVLRRAQQTASWPDLKSFREHTQVAQVRDTSVITVAFRDQDAQRAADIANLIANSFVEQARALQSSLQSTTLTQLDKDVQSIEADLRRIDMDLTQLRATLASLPAFPQAAPAEVRAQITQLESTRSTRQQSLDQLQKTRDDLRLVAARAENTVTIWESAVAPIEAESPRVALNTLAGAIGGALLGVAAIVRFGYLGDRNTDFDRLRERLGVQASAPR
jgi:capsular polysaccharide biosynthesis protein